MGTQGRWNAAGWLLPVLLLSLAGCAPLSPVVVAPPVIPEPPATLMVPPSSESYSESALRLLRGWRLRLTPSATD